MKLYAQQGAHNGSDDRDKIMLGLQRGCIQGAILSPKDYGIDRTKDLLARIAEEHSDADRIFDPQFYASLLAHDPDARMGKLISEDYPYFQARRKAQLEREANVLADLKSCLEFQAELAVTAVISPNIVIRQRFNSVEAVISKNFIRNTCRQWEEVGDGRPVYATLAMDAEALQDRAELEEFLNDITLLEEPPDGFYLLVHNPSSEIAPELVDPRTMAGWMLMNHALNLNGFKVINGFSDILTPFLCAAGGAAGATGWYNTQKVFSLDRYAPPSPGGRRPVMRYLSKGLLNSIRFDELHRLRRMFPGVLNGLPSDAFYDIANGSEPEGQIQEVLQTWESIHSFAPEIVPQDLPRCLGWITSARKLYDQVGFAPGMRLMGRSNNAHLDALEGGLQLFAQLAEIETPRQ
jgi:hypothetical protein